MWSILKLLKDELAVLLGLILVATGMALVWVPGAFIVPGLVMLWLFLPARQPFLRRPLSLAARKTAR